MSLTFKPSFKKKILVMLRYVVLESFSCLHSPIGLEFSMLFYAVELRILSCFIWLHLSDFLPLNL